MSGHGKNSCDADLGFCEWSNTETAFLFSARILWPEQEIRPLTLAFPWHELSGRHEVISLFKKKTKTFLFWIKIPDDRGTQKLKYSEWKVA